MPRPKGWSEEDDKKREEYVKSMLDDPEFHARAGESRSDRAYAVATAQVDKEKHGT